MVAPVTSCSCVFYKNQLLVTSIGCVTQRIKCDCLIRDLVVDGSSLTDSNISKCGDLNCPCLEKNIEYIFKWNLFIRGSSSDFSIRFPLEVFIRSKKVHQRIEFFDDKWKSMCRMLLPCRMIFTPLIIFPTNVAISRKLISTMFTPIPCMFSWFN